MNEYKFKIINFVTLSIPFGWFLDDYLMKILLIKIVIVIVLICNNSIKLFAQNIDLISPIKTIIFSHSNLARNSSIIKIDSLPNLFFHFEADSGVVSGVGGVKQWNDIGPNALNVQQLTASQQPKLVVGDPLLNGYPYIVFDGVDDFLNSTSFNLSQPLNYFLIINPKQFTGDMMDGGSVGTHLIRLGSANNFKYNFSSGSAYVISTTLIDTNIFVILNIELKSGIAKLYINNNLESTGFTGNNNSGGLTLGALGNVSNFLKVILPEMIAFSDTISDSLRTVVYSYLINKYAPPVNLGIDINVPYGYCDTILRASSIYKLFLWSTGETTQAIHANKGQYWVKVTDIFGFTSSDTINVTYPGNFKPFLDTTICYGNSIKWNTQLNKKGYSFLWKGGSTDSVLAITQAGKYYVKVTDTLGCIRYSDTIKVAVDSFPITTSLGLNTTICSGASIALVSGVNPANSYTWSTGATTSSIIISTTGTYSLTVKNANGCSAKDSIHVHVKGVNPIPGFISPAACFGDSMHFTDISTVTLPAHITQWSWNFGDAALSSLKNPSHSYSVAGTYTTTLTVVSDSGCSATVQKVDTVHNKPNANFSIPLLPACSGTNTHFSDQSSVLNNFLVSWKWNFGDPSSGSNTSIVQNPAHIYNAAGTHTVQLIVTSDKGCTDTVLRVVNVNQTPSPSFIADTVCQGIGTDFTGASIGVISTWVWDFGDGNNSTNQNTANTYAAAGTYNVMLTVTSDSGCWNSYTHNIMVYYLPVSNFSSDSVCVNAPLQLIDASSVSGSSIISWNWQFGSIGSSTQQNPVVTFTPSGTYSVSLAVTSAQGCSASSVQSVQAMPLPVPSFSFSPQYGSLPLNVSFTNQSSGAFSYLWSFGDGGQSALANPSHIFQNTGLYYIKLVSESKFGCKDSLIDSLKLDVPFLDVAVKAVFVSQQPNAIQISATLFNEGTIDANSIQLSAYLDDGTPVLETWTDTLTRQASGTYLFNSSLAILSSKKHNIVCVDVVLVNGRADDVLSNNHSCTAITNDFTLLNPFPNPAGDDIYFLFVLPLDGPVSLEIYDVRGRKVEAFEENASKGLNQVTYHTLKLSRGIYFLKLYYKDIALGKMFMKQ